MDEIDLHLLTIIQKGFPIDPQPYKILGNKLCISEDNVLSRIANLKSKGFIRRIGGVFDSKALGYTSTLCAMKVPEDKIEEVAEIINSLPEVTHNYLREHDYNLWFTLIAPSQEELYNLLTFIKNKTTIHRLINLPATNLFKINVHFDLKEANKCS
ncbi:Lrp/AsnC family transcriptional regulator [Serpentinicella sp. ANB-PHB4]|uniref:siroheme decarboxylase subunit alpha n=1 Tax=Serpentinicella sp. ANB-PHB4 TaxID=3074076 RepID=UPI002855E42F|nr:Lrp/AsnC family transcriptional regulator [Serpentinicella sp. ANB-PHB4]MDR5659660.1 Lrp/AsnC family transcriptional regulator [Serpentinicella sp. ANB-PHB4]